VPSQKEIGKNQPICSAIQFMISTLQKKSASLEMFLLFYVQIITAVIALYAAAIASSTFLESKPKKDV